MDGISITWPTIDWSALAKEIVPDFFNAVADWSSGVEHDVWSSMWGSDANVFGHTDANLVRGGPIATYAQQAQAAALGIVVFAIVVLGLRAALSPFVPMSNHLATELVERVASALILAGAFVLLAPRLLGWLNDALHEVGDVDFSRMFHATGSTGAIAFVFALLALLVLFFAGKLIIRVLYRTALLAIFHPVGIVALVLRAVPQLRWVSGWWARLWFGWLVAQVPSAMALVIGVQRRASRADHHAGGARARQLQLVGRRQLGGVRRPRHGGARRQEPGHPGRRPPGRRRRARLPLPGHADSSSPPPLPVAPVAWEPAPAADADRCPAAVHRAGGRPRPAQRAALDLGGLLGFRGPAEPPSGCS